jgi:hypothetical protein
LGCGAEAAIAIRELDFGGLAALLGFAECAAQLVELRARRERHHDVITSFLVTGRFVLW